MRSCTAVVEPVTHKHVMLASRFPYQAPQGNSETVIWFARRQCKFQYPLSSTKQPEDVEQHSENWVKPHNVQRAGLASQSAPYLIKGEKLWERHMCWPFQLQDVLWTKCLSNWFVPPTNEQTPGTHMIPSLYIRRHVLTACDGHQQVREDGKLGNHQTVTDTVFFVGYKLHKTSTIS